MERDRFALQLKCQSCGQQGHIIWEENGGEERAKGPQRSLHGLSPGFDQVAGKTDSGDAKIVCRRCQTQVPDHL
jgi:ribosomal protein L37E